jgi:hypothetical protein
VEVHVHGACPQRTCCRTAGCRMTCRLRHLRVSVATGAPRTVWVHAAAVLLVCVARGAARCRTSRCG